MPPGYWETRGKAAAVAVESGVKVTSDLDLNIRGPNIIIEPSVHRNMSIGGIALMILSHSDQAHLFEGYDPPGAPYRISSRE